MIKYSLFSFPNLITTQLLITYGNRWVNVDAVDTSRGNTALHIVSQSTKPAALSIVELLLNEVKTLLRKQQTPFLLKCLCARYIVEKQINYKLIWPETTKFSTFIYLHGCIAKENHVD
jgi:hypothetical protein